ncbi:MAG: hypothetical protein JWO80_2394 [Bryobacterales bacterium]|nr:hypothetical protein [Bryobacterales bacterium]
MRNKSSIVLVILPVLAFGKDKETPAVAAARQAFEKVESSSSIPISADLRICIETQQDAHKAVPKPFRPILQARQSYCEFLDAALTGDPAALAKSAAALNSARGDGRNDSAALLKICAMIAMLKSTAHASLPAEAAQDLYTLIPTLNCLKPGFGDTRTCNAVGSAAHLWLGWVALRKHELIQAEAAFHHVDGTSWNAWVTGIYALDSHRWRDASLAFGEASASWPIHARSLVEWLGPKLAPGELPAQLAYAQAMAGDFEAAIPNLDAAIAARPDDALSLFLRSRLRESLPDLEAAIKAAAPDQAHFYRAVLFERRHEYPAAIRELDAAAVQRNPDIAAWKALTNAASGECSADPAGVEKAVAGVTPLFPKQEYAIQVLECRLRTASSLEDLKALDSAARPVYLVPSGSADVRGHMAAAYVRHGLQAEDRKDSEAAVSAYRRALEWSPQNTRARFNLAAVYLGESKFDLAETEFRALLALDQSDREAQFWLSQSILAATPGEVRKAEACGLMQQSVQIQDSAKRERFVRAISTSACAK